MAETIDTLAVELTANLAPLFESLEAGLKQVRDKVQGFKEGRIDITASVDKMLAQLGDAKGKAAVWKRETDAVSVVAPRVSPEGFLGGLSELQAKAEGVARQLGNIFFAAAGFREITRVFGDWMRASGEQEVALARLRASLSAAGAAGIQAYEPLKRQAEELAEKYGLFGDEAIESAQAVLASFKLTETQIAALTPVLLDAATGLTKMGEGEVSLEQVAMLVGKALNGHAEALMRLGIQVDATRYKIDPLGATVAALASRFQGLTAAVAETDEGKLKGLSERWGEIKKTLGNLVKSVLVPLAEALRPVLNLFLTMPEPVRNAAVVVGIAAMAMRAFHLNLLDVAVSLLGFVERLGVAATAAAARFAAAMASMDWAAMTSGITSTAAALAGMVNGLNLASKGILLVAAWWAGWQIGRWISDVTGLTAAVSTAAQADRTWSEAELARFAAQLQAKTGIEMSAEAMRLWIRLSPNVRAGFIQEAEAAGGLTVTVQDLTAAMQRQIALQQELSRQQLWADERRQLDEYLAYYRMSRANQIAFDIAAVEQRLAAAQKGTDEEKKLQQELSRLLKDAAQEKVRGEQDAARQAAEAAKRSFEEQKAGFLSLVKTWQDGLRSAEQKWEDFSRKIAGDMLKGMDPAEYERAQIRLQAADAERAARAVETGQALADALVRIEEWKTEQIRQINDKERQDEAEKQQRALEQEQQQAERSLRQAQERLREQVRAILDPMGEMVRKAYDTMSVGAAVWAERVAQMMQPLQQAIQSFLMGMKVNWANVLRQMLVTFVMQFVNKFLAWVASMVVAWVTGEETKSTASLTAAAEQLAAAKTTQVAAAGVAAASMSAAIAEIFEAHAWIPFAGVAIATAFSIEALAAWQALSAAAAALSMTGVAMATGGLVDRPTLALVGEAGPELVAPLADFKEVVGGIVSETMATLRLAAFGVGDAFRGSSESPSAGLVLEPHYHGFAFVDSGRKSALRSAARKLNRAVEEERRQRLGR
jgi:hypothetical protein